MKHVKKTGVCLLALLLAFGLLASPFQAHAAAKTALSKTKATLAPGESVQLKLKNAPKGKSVKWSSSKRSVASVSQKGKVTAKKAGKAKITVTVSKKSYSCTVTVKIAALTNTRGKNAADVKALEKIITDQLRRGASVSADLNHYQYRWDQKGRLAGIDWMHADLNGNLDLGELSALKEFSCYDNKLSSLDISGCPVLEYLNCSENRLVSLDISRNGKLFALYCFENQLVSLDLSNNKKLATVICSNNSIDSLDVRGNTALYSLDCGSNQISSLDVSKNTMLSFLSCGNNQLTSLDVSCNKELKELYCAENSITSLDLTGNTELIEVVRDEVVTVIGYQPKEL